MSLHLVIGFDAQGSSARPHSVYVGRSKTEAQEAMAASNAARFEVFSNVTGVRKNNPRHTPALPTVAAPAAVSASEPAAVKPAAEADATKGRKK